MTAAMLVMAVVLAGNEPYLRTHVGGDGGAHCLWWGEDAVVFHQSVVGNPTTRTGTEFTAVTRAFQAWSPATLGCGHLQLTEGPRTTSRIAGVPPSGAHENVVLFRMSDCTKKVPAGHACLADGSCANTFDCWQDSKSVLGLTTVSYDTADGRIFDADIELNSATWVFTTVDVPVCTGAPAQTCVATDVQNTVTHEAGHLLGLDHTDRAHSTMNASAPLGETSKRVVDEGSRDFMCAAYPAGGAAVDCRVDPASEQLGAAAPVPKGGCSSAGGDLGWWLLVALLGVLGRTARASALSARSRGPDRQVPQLHAPPARDFARAARRRGSRVPHSHFAHLGLALALGLLLWAPAAQATTLVALDVEALARSSDVVVRGTVATVSARWTADRARIVTEVEVTVQDAWKGGPVATVRVLQPGGAVGRVGQHVAGAVPFTPGQDLVLFLEAQGPVFVLAGFTQGAWRVDPGEVARPVAALTQVELVDARTGLPTTAALAPMPLATLAARVRATLPAPTPGAAGLAPR